MSGCVLIWALRRILVEDFLDRHMPPCPEEIAVAYHEAGHAVMALSLGRNIQRVSIAPNVLRLGHCEIKKGAARGSSDPLESQALILLAGLAAEARHSGHYAWEGAQQDLRTVRELSRRRAGSVRQAERLERRLLDKAEHLLNQPGIWPAVERMALQLLQHTTISGRAARHAFDQALADADGVR